MNNRFNPYKFIYLLSVALCLLLSACSKKQEVGSIDINTVFNADSTEILLNESESEASIEDSKESEAYNTVEELDADIARSLRNELSQAAEICRPIYTQAEKGDALNKVLSSADIYSMAEAIAALGYPAVDYYQTFDMKASDTLQNFCEMINGGNDISGTYYMIFTDGQISQYTLIRENGSWHMVTMTATWNDNCEPTIKTSGRFVINNVSYTEKGRLIFNRNFSDFDDNQKSNSGSWILVKVTPTDSEKKKLCTRYVESISYFENNLFTTNWDSSNYTPIDFNSLYAYLFKLYTATEILTSYNVYSYYTPLENTGLYLIPAKSFESVVDNYFNISNETLRAISDYNYSTNEYYFLGYRFDYYNVLPRTPYPEVVDYWYNQDGSLTMRIDAVNEWYGTDKAFSHELTVKIESNGSYKYISNRLITDENSILPTNKLSGLLDVKLKEYLNK